MTISGVSAPEELSLERKRALLGELLRRVATEADRDYPLTPVQKRLWFFEQLEPGTWFYNVPARLAFDGALDAAALARALEAIVRRHDALRTTIDMRGDEPRQLVSSSSRFELASEDLSGLPAADRAARLEEFAGAEVRRPFDLARGPLFRATLVTCGDRRHVLFATAHHIVCDGLSVRVLLGELSALYAAFAAGTAAALPPLRIQYGSFAVREQAHAGDGALDEDAAYWRNTLAHARPTVELPVDRARPPRQTFRGQRVYGALDAETVARLRELGKAHGATLFMTLLAAFAALLCRYTDQEDLVIGSPIGGRHDADTERLIGCFVNMLALRCDVTGDPSFRALLERARDAALGAYRHQRLPFDRLVEELHRERDPQRAPVFQVVLNMGSYADAWTVASPDLAVTLEAPADEPSMVDLTLYAIETPDGVQLRAVFKADLFDVSTIDHLLRRFECLAAAAARNPDLVVSALPLTPPAETATLAAAFAADLEAL